MDCCNYGEYRGQAQYGAGAGWDYRHGYPPTPYVPYPHTYYPHAHDYARYYRYDYPPQPMHHADHVMPTDYGAYALKDARARRALTRREQRAHPTLQHFPVSHTPPLECGMNSRGHAYCEPQMWSHYQMGVLAGNGWNGTNGGMWSSRVPNNMCSREPMRYGPDCRLMKNSQNHNAAHDGRSTPYPVYDQSTYEKGCKSGIGNKFPIQGTPSADFTQPVRESPSAKPRSPPAETRPPVVPLPAFQQAFGSTEIGKFAEAFSRTEITHEPDESCDNFVYEPFNEWDGSPEPQWAPPATREIKCEDNF
ncbi:uncharacterized protein LOC119831286 [Zerene cesonia]|uniref:uncharacterized protein LOC119831286 n=1 Tax=Zerene cesonia TaxID=33412 RepID=UPI0018E53EAF|nr:uncharacterized protein LOC119831286 [Zerene cesonia]